VASGEWDLKEKLQISLIGDDNYCGRIGSTASTPVGVDRFCGKESCSIAADQKAQLLLTPGFWYIYTGRTYYWWFLCRAKAGFCQVRWTGISTFRSSFSRLATE
jgi:hypothetical protein